MNKPEILRKIRFWVMYRKYDSTLATQQLNWLSELYWSF